MEDNKIIIFGSNFGSVTHLTSAKDIKKFSKISICSPNIKKKSQFKKLETYNDYNDALKNNFNFVSIATPPFIQSNICNKIFKKKKIPKFIFLEKPIATNFKETKKIITKLNKRRINFLVNFIFDNIPAFVKLKKIISKKKIISVKYKWFFRQKYFENKKRTWKTNYKKGGGIINYYLIHVFYNLLLYFDDIKIKYINIKKTGSIITNIDLKGETKDEKKIQINIDINSKNTIHQFFILTKKGKFNLINKTKDWVKNFTLYKNNKMINLNENNINRKILTLINYKKLIKGKYSKHLTTKRYLISHKLCNQIINQIYI